jgi:hypothetical protein
MGPLGPQHQEIAAGRALAHPEVIDINPASMATKRIVLFICRRPSAKPLQRFVRLKAMEPLSRAYHPVHNSTRRSEHLSRSFWAASSVLTRTEDSDRPMRGMNERLNA